MIDLRSDTVTTPSKLMQKAMAEAEVGDDVYGEDPTVNLLQEYCADLFGKERALYVPSGTMANQVSLNAHTQPGDEVICDYGSHIFNYECGSPGILSGVQLHPLHGDHGIPEVGQIREAIRPDNVHQPTTKVIALENTHNRAGGIVFPLERIREIASLAEEYGLVMHLDGARLMNAVIATDTEVQEYTRYFDSVTLCFSKGLGAPVGSIVAGSEEFIRGAHRYRKVYGGGMRQAGIIAAGALYAIRNNVERLQEDHENAKALAEGIADLPGIGIETEWVHTNIVIFDVTSDSMQAAELCDQLRERGVSMLPFSRTRVRAVTNLLVSEKDIEYTIRQFQEVLEV